MVKKLLAKFVAPKKGAPLMTKAPVKNAKPTLAKADAKTIAGAASKSSPKSMGAKPAATQHVAKHTDAKKAPVKASGKAAPKGDAKSDAKKGVAPKAAAPKSIAKPVTKPTGKSVAPVSVKASVTKVTDTKPTVAKAAVTKAAGTKAAVTKVPAAAGKSVAPKEISKVAALKAAPAKSTSVDPKSKKSIIVSPELSKSPKTMTTKGSSTTGNKMSETGSTGKGAVSVPAGSGAPVKAAKAKGGRRGGAGASAARAYDFDGCRESGCESASLTAGYCRLHYIKNWKKIKRKELILREKKLDQYIEELVSKYPDKYLEAIRGDLAEEKAFSKVIYDLELEETLDDVEGDDENEDNVIESIRRDFDDEGDF